MQIKSEHNPTLHLGKIAGVAQEVKCTTRGTRDMWFSIIFFLKKKRYFLCQNQKAQVGTLRKVFRETFLVVCMMLLCEKQSK